MYRPQSSLPRSDPVALRGCNVHVRTGMDPRFDTGPFGCRWCGDSGYYTTRLHFRRLHGKPLFLVLVHCLYRNHVLLLNCAIIYCMYCISPVQSCIASSHLFIYHCYGTSSASPYCYVINIR